MDNSSKDKFGIVIAFNQDQQGNSYVGLFHDDDAECTHPLLIFPVYGDLTEDRKDEVTRDVLKMARTCFGDALVSMTSNHIAMSPQVQ